MMVFFPCLVMIGLYIHMIVSVNSSVVASAESKAKLRGKMTRMVAIFCFILIICYTPSRIFLFLAFTGNVNIYSTVNGVLSLLTFFSNCINPLVQDSATETFSRGTKMFSLACVEDMPNRLTGKVIKDNKYRSISEAREHSKMCL